MATALITGVGRRQGIAFAVARRLIERGDRVVVQSWAPHDAEQPWGADVEGAAAVVAELGERVRVEHLEADLADPDAPAQLLAAAQSAYGRVDVLVANHARSSVATLEELTAAELDFTYAVNTRATLLLVKEFAARCPGPGRVVLMTSGQHRGAMPAELPYIASKGALHQVTASLAAHLAPRGITVNTVDPGATDTGYADAAAHAAVLALEPMGRWGEPDDAARLIAWLVSDAGRWVTGQVLVSNGGGP